MFSKTIIGAAILAFANAQKKPKADCRGEDLNGDTVITKTAAFGYMPAMEGIRTESIFVGLAGAEGEDQDEIMAWGKGLRDTGDDAMFMGSHGSDNYYKYNITLQEESSAGMIDIPTNLSLFDTKGKGYDCLSKASKVTGDFCLTHNNMDPWMITLA